MMKKNHLIAPLFFLLYTANVVAQHNGSSATRVVPASRDVISLAGIWKCKLDPFFTGISANGVQLMPGLPEEITLPGSTDQAGKGIKTQEMTSLRLTRQFEYKGPVWYEKEVFVPENWHDKEIRLFLERAHWETAVWVNGRDAGRRESLSVPHLYDITGLVKPGKKNTIRIRVDNNLIYNIEHSHAVSAETQTNWNGIIGSMELQAFDKIHIDDVQVYPKPFEKKAAFEIVVVNKSKKPVKGTISVTAQTFNTAQKVTVPAQQVAFAGSDSLITVRMNWLAGDNMQWWDEFNPALYRATVAIKAEQDDITYENNRTVEFGMRQWGVEGTRFTINGRKTFIRGTVNCAEFPLTGYPAMDEEAWTHILSTVKAYGNNLVRFHSWCPPKAAFMVADRLGIYLQVENSDWRFTIGKDSAVNRFLTEEADRILKTYGNHPSFAMFCEGNELVGPTVKTFLGELVNRWKKDPRHLYTGSSGYPIIPENDFHEFYGARPQLWKQGLKGRFNVAPLQTLYDYTDHVKKHNIPLVTHEIGQWCVYPDFDEIKKYTGVLRPFNYELFRESLREHNMLDLAKTFTIASGKWQVLQKKEEIESYLRTPNFGGYHLLQLNDFPGQGTAPVGVVDIFYDPKVYVTAEEFRRFQSAGVPLLRTSGFTWTNDQEFTADIEFAHFGNAEIKNATVHWRLQFEDGTLFRRGSWQKITIPVESPVKLGSLRLPLRSITQASRLTLVVEVAGTSYRNDWDIWVYPKTLPEVSLAETMVAHAWNDEVKNYLQQGGTVLLLPDTGAIRTTAEGVFSGISWNTVWSGMPPNLLGILCDPAHPALQHFPTQFHTNWQWWDVVRHSKPFVLDHTPAAFRPLVQMIPDWNTNEKIGLLLEAKVGKGKLLLSAVDLKNKMAERPVARQFLYSLKKYVSSTAFNPKEELSLDMLDAMFKK